MAVSEYYTNRILDRLLGSSGTAIPIATHYIALSTTTPNYDGTNFTEPTGGYARQSVTASTFWSASSGTATSLVQVDYLASGSAWGTITYMGIFDALTLGNMLWFLPLDMAELIQDGDDSHFPIGDLQLSMSGGGFTNSFATIIIDDVANDGPPYTPSASLQMGLSTTAPNPNGTNFTEPVGANYNRASLTNNATNFPAASGGVKTTGGAFTFPEATGSWGTISHWGIFDGGLLEVYGPLTTPTAVVSGDRPVFRPGEINVALT